MDTSSNLQVSSNLMLVTLNGLPVDQVRYIPGDYVGKIYPWVRDYRSAGTYLSAEQLLEREQYLVCLICGRPCAGTCGGT